MRRPMDRRGQAIVEVTVGFIAIVAAIIALGYYVQRAIQGNVFQGAQSLGQQFHPDEFYEETQRLGSLSETVDVTTGLPMISAPLLAGPDDCLVPVSAEGCLPDIPMGTVPREPGGLVQMSVTTNWESTHDAHYTTPK